MFGYFTHNKSFRRIFITMMLVGFVVGAIASAFMEGIGISIAIRVVICFFLGGVIGWYGANIWLTPIMKTQDKCGNPKSNHYDV